MHKSNELKEEAGKKNAINNRFSVGANIWYGAFETRLMMTIHTNLCYYLSFYRFWHNMLSSVVEKTDGLPCLRCYNFMKMIFFFLFSFLLCCCAAIHCVIIRNVFLLWHFSTLSLHFVFDLQKYFIWNCRFRVTWHTVSQSIWIIRMRSFAYNFSSQVQQEWK